MSYVFAALTTVMLTATIAIADTPKVFTEADAIEESKKFDMMCNKIDDQEAEREAAKIDFDFSYSYDDAAAPARSVTYFIVTCDAGAYNRSSVLLRVNDYEGTLNPVALAAPRTTKKGVITGWMAEVVNSQLSYDPATHKLRSMAKGRGIGDMGVIATYELFENDVVLREYFIDSQAGKGEAPGIVYESTLPLDR